MFGVSAAPHGETSISAARGLFLLTFLSPLLTSCDSYESNDANGFLIALIGLAVVGLVVYLNIVAKARSLKRLGYEMVYHYMKNCGQLNYYTTRKQYIGSRYQSTHDQLRFMQSKWYLSSSTKEILARQADFYDTASSLTTSLTFYFSPDHYFCYSECESFNPSVTEVENAILQLASSEFKDYIRGEHKDTDISSYPSNKKYAHNLHQLRAEHNVKVCEKQLRDNKTYFDEVLEYPLDSQQRVSIVKLEDNCLVISSAGSGKTSTSIAKVKYMIERRHLKKEEVLVMSYNNKTAAEFRKRLNMPGVTCETFHAQARHIVMQVEGCQPDISDASLLLICHQNLVDTKPEYKAAVNQFFTKEASLTQLPHNYETAEKYYADRAKYGIMPPYGDKDKMAIYTKSEEEKRLCTWLSEHGVAFKYEEPYPIRTADNQYRQYKPDFTIYYQGRAVAYLEHFGIDAQGNVPRWFGDGAGGFNTANIRYNSGIQWKRSLHQQHHTILLETTSAQFQDGSVYNRLEQQLRQVNIPIRVLSEDEKYELLMSANQTIVDAVKTLLQSTISLMKSNEKTIDEVKQQIKEAQQTPEFENRCTYLLDKIIKPLYDKYEQELRQRGQVDFTDLILRATRYCEEGKWKSPFKQIVVDEFQDISTDRYKLIQALRQKQPLTKTYCVGDDWQSIYRFSGSDLNLFQHMERYFGFTERCRVETTYRFGDPLLTKSSNFILKNPGQAAKTVRPQSANVKTELTFVAFSRREPDNYLEKIESIIQSIPADESVLMIARYNKDVRVFPFRSLQYQPNSKYPDVDVAGRTIKFMSIHGAKGLEADHILILNCSQDGGGFPSRIAEDPILGYVLSEIDDFPYSEERRLFYVGITRAKKQCYVLYNDQMPSDFVTECQEDGNSSDEYHCPVCKRGLLKSAEERVAENGRLYRNYRCSNSVAGCRFFWRVFYDDAAEVQRRYDLELSRYFR